jgi:hypothetical protein
LTLHLHDGGVVEKQPMLDRVAPTVKCAMQAFAVIRVTRDFVPPAMGLIDDGLQLFHRKRRL